VIGTVPASGEREFTDVGQQVALPGLRRLLLGAKIVLLGAKMKKANLQPRYAL
jgi:hypothetical protein